MMDDGMWSDETSGDPLDEIGEFRAAPKKAAKRKNFAIVPLDDDWGYQALSAAGRGAAIVVYVLREQRAREYRGDGIPITAAMLRRFGISPETRAAAIKRLVAGGFATVRQRGRNRGCPLLTLIIPAADGGPG
jgi:hypothetical protein